LLVDIVYYFPFGFATGYIHSGEIKIFKTENYAHVLAGQAGFSLAALNSWLPSIALKFEMYQTESS